MKRLALSILAAFKRPPRAPYVDPEVAIARANSLLAHLRAEQARDALLLRRAREAFKRPHLTPAELERFELLGKSGKRRG